jgi:hypothetical protein
MADPNIFRRNEKPYLTKNIAGDRFLGMLSKPPSWAAGEDTKRARGEIFSGKSKGGK